MIFHLLSQGNFSLLEERFSALEAIPVDDQLDPDNYPASIPPISQRGRTSMESVAGMARNTHPLSSRKGNSRQTPRR